MSLLKGSNSALSSSSFFLSSSSSMSRPSFVVDFSFLPSNSFSCCTAYSSTGSTMYRTSRPFFRRFSRNGDDDLSHALAGDVIDVVLALLHAIHILFQTDGFITRFGRLVPQELSNLLSVRGVLMDAQLQALAELFIELLVVVLFLRDLRKHLEALLHQVFLDHSENLVLLKRLARNVQRQILRVHHALNKVQPFRHELIAVVHDEDTANVKLDVISLLLGLEEVERSTARHEDQCPELQLPLHAEVFHGQVVFPIVRQRLVERRVLLVRHILRLPHPQGLVFVQLLPLVGHLLHLLGLFLLFLLLLLLVHLLDLWLVTVLPLLLLLLLLILGIRNFLLL